jgi:hypothetical protein
MHGFGDASRFIICAQRTEDDRIAIGGRGRKPHRLLRTASRERVPNARRPPRLLIARRSRSKKRQRASAINLPRIVRLSRYSEKFPYSRDDV